ncbi:MAG TPA: ABC transporter permease [Candidatus Hydrothermia bacterium]|nr:ABC transporter permease [Candidatus Hydrothermae bacterium]MDD3648661.1 ABC transporter permease [Candidatus Hydrothermia bacterium]MDD5572242.1 ABC transporter permease [Candidatus Hydrothermia bacterium]HOL23186.1 ABC transporter permease [Candidatus Hydrothermia bacterium]HPO78196.1 ABC transporter permease [Candidatus Hydrothermia bacterium]
MISGIKNIFRNIGSYFLMLYYSISGVAVLRKDEIFKQLEFFSVNSLFIVALAAAFTGMVTSVQSAYQIMGLLPLDLLGAGVGKMITIELGPVLTALILAGRAGASIASELATMKVTEQLDAMEVMGVDPYKHLIFPRILAGTLITPLLVVFADAMGILSSSLASKFMLEVEYSVFFAAFLEHFYIKDFIGGIIKGIAFGFVITSISCFMGINTREGAKGVGISTMRAVIYSSVFVLLSDYIIGSIIYG